MKIQREGLQIIIVSESLATVLTRLLGFKKAMGFAIFPCFIILRTRTHPMTSQWINHERIHLTQFAESLGLFWIYSKGEYFYYRFIKGLKHDEAYRREGIEQETYLNQHNQSYLQKRSWWNTIRYFQKKTPFYTNKSYHVVVGFWEPPR